MRKVQLTIDLDSPKMVATQLKEQIERLVEIGLHNPGQRLPTVRQLAVEMELNANTVKRICESLENEGVLMWREGAGLYCIDLREKTAKRRAEVFNV